MLKKISLRPFLVKNSYLLIIAAWLVTLSFIINNYWAGNSSVKVVQKKISEHFHEQERDFETLSKDTAVLNRLVTKQYDIHFLEEFTHKTYYLFIYPAARPYTDNILFWNTQTIQPEASLLSRSFTLDFVKLSNGYYVCRKVKTGDYLVVGLMPVKWSYDVNNIYLENNFTADDDINEGYDLSLDISGQKVISSLNNTPLFSIYKKSDVAVQKDNIIAAWLRIVAAFLVLLFIHLLASAMVPMAGAVLSSFLLIAVVVLLRVISYYFPIPLNFKQFELFSSTIYASSDALNSLGDLLINSILIIWLMLFIRQHLLGKKGFTLPSYPVIQWIGRIAGAFLLIFITLKAGRIIQTIVADSNIPFDVVEFSSLNIYSVLGFFALCCIATGYLFTIQLVLFFLNPLFKERPSLLFLVIAVCGLLTLSLRTTDVYAFELSLMTWLLLFLFLINYKPLNFISSRPISSKLIFWLFFFSLSITVVIVIETRAKERKERRLYADTLSNKKSRKNEALVSTMLADFRGDYLSNNFEHFRDRQEGTRIRDSLIGTNISSYLASFTTRIYIFDKDNLGMSNPDTTSFETFKSILVSQARPTQTAGISLFDESYNGYTYISYQPVKDTGDRLLGSVYILASSNRNNTATPSAALFTKGYSNSIENSSIYAFAVYDKSQLITRHNDYNFPTKLTAGDTFNEEYVYKDGQNDYDELWYRPGPGKMVIIARQNKFIIESITLFSYLFCSFLLMAGILWLLNSFVTTRFNRQKMEAYWQLTIRNQVYGTIIFISLLSFIVIGVATILFFINRYENNNREKLSTSVQLMERELRNGMEKMMFSDDVIKVYDSLNLPHLDSLVDRVAKIHNTDINLYDLEGNLRASSLHLPYDLGVIGRKINPVAYYRLSILNDAQYFEKEKIGRLEYLSNYIPLIDESGHEYAYLNVSYFLSQANFSQEISNFIVTIINLNAFIFLIAGIVALIIANRVTQSFSFISAKMSDVNLGKMNEAIAWNRNDEIGQLVSEYNKMVGKLDESAAALAKSERESAWREMARQVAHEIKNPLTPMKLSLQYLQKAIASKAPNVSELSASVAQTLVEQIDHLSQIASEFSQFANIGNPKKEKFDLNEALRIVIHLHSAADSMQLEWKEWPEPLTIFADRTHINRLFTNLLLNAIQSVPQDRNPIVVVESSRSGNNILVMIHDNGEGIPEGTRTNIFTPNFTTKTSGTGLGLAMCKGIVEQMHGAIWFETKVGKGTTFYVELPLSAD